MDRTQEAIIILNVSVLLFHKFTHVHEADTDDGGDGDDGADADDGASEGLTPTLILNKE